ncbi:aldose epimerase family protein [Edaphobacter albus]|uniref:aldose epimerase family protein n=1 Tax=Edaphobacter sp. 4G125 TaxID=2763071 RepID=UPI0016459905|nr:hypothetical protein [Edaphobacter sp. 4G125]QNI35408.1 hypothetical protein H7846_09935 [Edaphobacter sp. 4G125]
MGSLRRLWQEAILRSGALTIVVIVLLVIGLAIGWRAHTRGRFAQLKSNLRHSSQPHEPPAPQPGGQDALVLERLPIEGNTVPEFLSATLLPGRGMNLLQLTAILPKKGRVSLLASPSLADAAKAMSGTDDDVHGAASLAMGGAIEAPWAGNIFGTLSGDSLNVGWQNTTLHLPGNRTSIASGGLLLAMPSTSSKTNIMPDGGEAEAIYDARNFDGAWPSHMQIRTSVQMSSRALEMKIIATNTGQAPEPVGIGWRPRFAVLNGDRGAILLRLPSTMREEIRDSKSGLPTGRLLSVEGSKYDFSSRSGTALKDLSLNDTFVHLKQAPLDSGPVLEMRDPINDYGLRITMLSPSIKAIHVESPMNGDFVMLEPRFNYDDPFGREWPKDEDTGMAVLQPGQSASWSIRLEIFSLNPPKQDQP